MPLTRTRSHAPGHVLIDAPSQKEVSTGSVSSDGRFKLHFHDDSESLNTWCRRIQSSIKPHDLCEHRNRRNNGSAATLPNGLPADGTGPRLNIAIHIVGSRGDVQPFIPIAQLLMKKPYGHRVRICTHPVFKDFIEAQGVEFFSIGGDPEALMAYMVKNPGLLPNKESVKAGDVGKRRAEMWEMINGAWRSCIEAGNGMDEPVKAAHVRDADDLFLADAIIANPPSMAHIHCAEKLGIPLHMVFTMPWSPTETFAHPLASMNYGGADAKTANYLSFIMMELLTWQGLGDLINKFRRQKLGLDPISPMWGFQLLPRLQVPFTYLWSQSLIPKPADWGMHVDIAGFSFLPLASSYTPPADMVAFLEKGPPPVYIGFGSIVVDDPEALTRMILQAVKLAGVRAMVSKGWSGMGGNDDIPDDVYLVGNCPHDWLFQRVSAVVHHGGAGTTAAGIAAGRPTVVVPFFGDQPFWGQMVARSGAGPEPVAFKQLTAEILAASITFALRPEVQVAAQKMAANIAAEDGAGVTAGGFHGRLDVEQFRCALCPDKLASWKHKKTGIRLSGFAVSCLVDRGVCQPSDCKLIQHNSWYVDEGAEHPVVGVAAAFTGLISSIVTATTDYTQALKHRPPPRSSEHEMTSQSFPQPANLEAGLDEGNSADSHMDGTKKHEGGYLESALAAHIFTPMEMELTAKKLAEKSLVNAEADIKKTQRQPTFHDKRKASWKAHEQGSNGRFYYVARATGRYVSDLTTAGLKAPVAFFYNMANGFHNYPSYGFWGVEVRRRDHITGFGSGVRTAGKEFVFGFLEAFAGIPMEPYKGAKEEGAKGFGKGIWRAGKGFFSNIGAAVFGLSGYTLKGIEKELAKHHLTKLKAELILIRIRMGIADFRRATPQEREDVVLKWQAICST